MEEYLVVLKKSKDHLSIRRSRQQVSKGGSVKGYVNSRTTVPTSHSIFLSSSVSTAAQSYASSFASQHQVHIAYTACVVCPPAPARTTHTCHFSPRSSL